MIRYQTNGFIDGTFGINGIAVIDSNSLSPTYWHYFVIQSDGRILSVGFDQYNISLRQFNTDGTLDINYANNGKNAGLNLPDLE